MTEDYKKTLIEYVSGLLNNGEPQYTDFNIQNINSIEYNSEAWEDIVSSFRLQSAAINGILENEKYDTFIMYGGYQEQENKDAKGFLIYINKYGTPYKLTRLSNRGILYLDFNEDANRVYGVLGDRATYQEATTNDMYFVYYNNLFLTGTDDYKPTITYSYKIFTGTKAVDKIVKDPSSSNYLIFTRTYAGLQNIDVFELKINVGQENELTRWQCYDNSNNYQLLGIYGWYENSNPHFKIVSSKISGANLTIIQNNGTSVNYTNITPDVSLNQRQQIYCHPQWISINENNIYFILLENWTADNLNNRQARLMYYNGTNIINIYKTDTTQNTPNPDQNYPIKNVPMLNILKDVDNTLYLLEYKSDEDENYTKTYLCNLTKDTELERWQLISTNEYVYRTNIFNQRAVLRRNYNIMNLFTFSGYLKTNLGNPTGSVNGYELNIQCLAPINGYVGNTYIDKDSLIPSYVNLYNNSSLLFSRNIYNVSKQNNMTMSSVEIPNSYLNDYNITNNNLVGKTNLNLVEDTTEWNKNIYEVVDLNFLNTIAIKDEDTDTPYLESAIKVNDATTDGGDINYQNTPCNKYRINYSDNTTAINTLSWNSINKYNKKTLITFYADKLINSIDLISNDESVIYLHIPVETEVGKYYTINQKVRIGDKPTPVQLQYNNEDINYNNQPVMVYVEE